MTEDKPIMERSIAFERKARSKNDILPPLIKTEQLHNFPLDLESPTFRTACANLGIFPEECTVKYRRNITLLKKN